MDACKFIAPSQPIIDVQLPLSEEQLKEIPDVTKGQHKLVERKAIETLLDNHSSDEIPATSVGGSATNVLKVLAYLGNECTVMGLTGSDAYAARYRSLLEKLGITCKLSTLEEESTGTSLCVIDPDDAERTMLTDLGAARQLTSDYVEEDDIPEGGHMHLEGYLVFHPDLLSALASKAKNRNCTVSLDLSDVSVIEAKRDDFDHLIKNRAIDVLFGNESEIKTLAGIDDALGVCQELGKFCSTVVTTMNKEGGWVKGNDGEVHKFPAMHLSRESVVDTTGAGDYFAGAFLHEWKRGKTAATCAAWGAAAGATIVQVPGADLNAEGWELFDRNVTTMIESVHP